MEPVRVKEALSFFSEYIFSVSKTKEMEFTICNARYHEGITISSEIQILIFFQRLVFFVICLCGTVPEFKS